MTRMNTNMLISDKSSDLLTQLFDEEREFKRLTKVISSSSRVSLFHLPTRSLLAGLPAIRPVVAISWYEDSHGHGV